MDYRGGKIIKVFHLLQYSCLYAGEKNLTCADLAEWVNDQLGLEEDNSYGESKIVIKYFTYIYPNTFKGTMCNWLHICGFEVTESKKGIYYDGHEREDVVDVSL